MMGDMSGVKFSLKKHNFYQKYCDSNNGDASSGYGFLNSHSLSQCEYSSMFNKIDDYVEHGDGDVSNGCGF